MKEIVVKVKQCISVDSKCCDKSCVGFEDWFIGADDVYCKLFHSELRSDGNGGWLRCVECLEAAEENER